MPVTLMDKFKEFLGIEVDPRANMTPQDIAKEKQDYSNEAMYFKKGSELNDKGPGNKINRSQVDAIVAAANMGVTMGLMDREMGDRFISNQFQELRNDFAVNAVDEKGKTIKLPVTPGDTYKAADALYGMESGRGATFYDPRDEKKGRKTIHIGREFSSEGKRYTTKDVNSPYSENIPPEQLQDNAKLALLTWISKRGKNVDETTMNWNGDRRYGAAEHLAKVKRREEDLMADYNKELRDYMNERIAYDSKYKATPSVQDKLKPSEQEMNIVNYHRNTIKSGKVGTDEEGRPVTVYATGIKIPEGKYKGQFVSVPGYFDGKIHSEGEAYNKWKNEINEGKWPLYKSADEINRRSKELHQIMDDEEQQALKSRDKSKK